MEVIRPCASHIEIVVAMMIPIQCGQAAWSKQGHRCPIYTADDIWQACNGIEFFMHPAQLPISSREVLLAIEVLQHGI